MTVTNYKFFRAQDLVCVNGQEIVLVSATPTTTTVTITRAYGEIAAKQALNGATIQILSNTNQEGALSRSLLSTQRVPVYNYCQIIRDPFGYTNTEMATDSFAGKDYVDEQAKQLIEHKKHIEYSLLFGQRYEDTTGTHPQRTTRGIYNWIATNVQDMSGGMTEIVLDGFLRVLGRYGTERKEKIVFASPIFMQAINQFAKSKLRTFNGESTYGITLTKYEAAGRTILLHEHNLMTNDPNLNDFSNFAGMAFFVDIKDLVLRYVKGRMTVFNSNIQANDADEREDEYLSEVGLELHQERFHGKAIGVNA